MERRKRQGREAWRRIVFKQERSGLTAAEFCRRADIGISSFYQWKRRLADVTEREGESDRGTFIDMGRVEVPESSAEPMSAERSGSLEVTLELGDGARLILRRG